MIFFCIIHLLDLLLLFLYFSRYHRDLHSFPTRRSSDLTAHPARMPAYRGAAGISVGGAHRAHPRRVHAARMRSMRPAQDRKSTRLNSSHVRISYAVFCLKKKKKTRPTLLEHCNLDRPTG